MYIKCQKCGKKLSDPESKVRGYGPECWGKVSRIIMASERERENNITGQMDIFDYPEFLPDRKVTDEV